MPDNQSVGDVGEFGLIRRIAEIVATEDGLVGIGDDTAVLNQPGDYFLLATTDMLVSGVHFHRSTVDPFDLGRRAIAINVSDIASMGGAPSYALTSLAVPPDQQLAFVEQLYRGMKLEADHFGLSVIGGNTTRIDETLVIDVAMLGQVLKSRVVLRSGAVPGDVLAVTGSLGRAAAIRSLDEKIGRAERCRRFPNLSDVPEPRLDAGKALADKTLAHAMIDLSDGLAGDVHHLAKQSGVGLLVNSLSLPIADDVREIATQLGLDPVDLAMTGGEDYELLVALPPDDLVAAQHAVAPVSLTAIGKVLEARDGVGLRTADGNVHHLNSAGWTHF